MERTYSTAEICRLCKLSKSTLFRWEREGIKGVPPFPPVGRGINDERQYTSKHIEWINKYANKKKYRRARAADDIVRLSEIEEELTLRKFISQRELATLRNLGHRELSDGTIKQLLQIALEEYLPQDEIFREIIRVIHEQVAYASRVGDVSFTEKPVSGKGWKK